MPHSCDAFCVRPTSWCGPGSMTQRTEPVICFYVHVIIVKVHRHIRDAWSTNGLWLILRCLRRLIYLLARLTNSYIIAGEHGDISQWNGCRVCWHQEKSSPKWRNCITASDLWYEVTEIWTPWEWARFRRWNLACHLLRIIAMYCKCKFCWKWWHWHAVMLKFCRENLYERCTEKCTRIWKPQTCKRFWSTDEEISLLEGSVLQKRTLRETPPMISNGKSPDLKPVTFIVDEGNRSPGSNNEFL